MERNGLISALEVGGDHFEAGLEYYRRETRPAKQPTEGKVFGNVIEERLEAFFSACREDVRYTQSQEYFADFAESNELEFYENVICIRHR